MEGANVDWRSNATLRGAFQLRKWKFQVFIYKGKK
jgi:hypothetical protein